MAHATEKRTQLRSLYVFKQLPMEAACAATHVPKSTGNRWKLEAKKGGDDWDDQRAAAQLGDENIRSMARVLLNDYLVQHKHLMQLLRESKDLTPKEQATMLQGLSDSFVKTVSSFKRMAPEINEHSVALDAMQRFTTFARQRYPKHLPALLEMLEPFGEELAKAYA